MQEYRVVEMKSEEFDVKNRFYVLQLCYVNRQNRPRYRLVKQCSSPEQARQYIEQRRTAS